MRYAIRVLLISSLVASASPGLHAQPTDRPPGKTTGATGVTSTAGAASNDVSIPEATKPSGNNGKAKGRDREKSKGPNENASQRAKDVHAVIEAFKAERDASLIARRTLLDKLRTASETERSAVLDDLRKEKRTRETEERSLGKQIREELKSLRGERKGSGE